MESHEHKKGGKPLTPLQEARLDRIAERSQHFRMERTDLLMSNLSDETFSTKQVADIFDRHPETVRRAIRNGELKASKLGRSYRISRLDLDDYQGRHGGTSKRKESSKFQKGRPFRDGARALKF